MSKLKMPDTKSTSQNEIAILAQKCQWNSGRLFEEKFLTMYPLTDITAISARHYLCN